MKAAPFTVALVFGIVVAMIATIMATWSTYLQQRAVIYSRNNVISTYETLNSLERVLRYVRDAEVAERGYVLTGSLNYLARYKDSMSKLRALGSTLEGWITDSPECQVEHERMDSILKTLTKEFNQIIELRNKRGLEAATKLIQKPEHLQTLEALEQTSTKIRDLEKSVLARQSNELARNNDLNMLMLVFLATIYIFIVLCGAFPILYFIKAQTKATRLATFMSTVNQQLTEDLPLETMLGKVTDLLVRDLDAAFARIWLFNRNEEVLELVASSGLYTHLDGAHSRILLGQLKIGLIAKTREPVLTNDVQHDPRISNPTWARQTGMVAFAGYPLILENELIGVIGLFSRCRLSKSALVSLENVADSISVAVKQKQDKERIVRSEDLFRHLAENINAAFVITRDDKRGALYVSPMVEQLYDVTPEQVLKNRFSFLRNVHKDDRAAVRRFMCEATEEDQASGLEFRVVHRDGSVHWIWGHLFPKTNGYTTVYGISQDITARKEAEARLKEFYSIVSHELRAPLTSIHASLRLMESGLSGPLPQKAEKVVAIGRKECDRLIRLINDLLNIDKMEAGMVKLSLTEVTTQELVELGVEAVKGMAQEYGVGLVKSVDWQGPIICDQDRMIEVLTNLLSNAIKYSPEQGTVTLTVTKMDSSMIRFSVIDNGTGIAREQMHKLFHKFQQLDSGSRKKAGTGLGLAIVKAIIEQHNGNVGVESEPGKGSTFWAELPMMPQETFAPMPQKSSAGAGRTDSG